MSSPLPIPIINFFNASGSDDDAVAAEFDAMGEVHDEGDVHIGRSAITAWARDVRLRYNFSLAIRDVEPGDGQIAVTAEVTGSFPGSSVVLLYRFRLAGEKIASLRIGVPQAKS